MYFLDVTTHLCVYVYIVFKLSVFVLHIPNIFLVIETFLFSISSVVFTLLYSVGQYNFY